jgi:hypothetical protein
MSRPIVLTSPMDGSPQVVRFDATTLWHLDAAEWAPSTASFTSAQEAEALLGRPPGLPLWPFLKPPLPVWGGTATLPSL